MYVCVCSKLRQSGGSCVMGLVLWVDGWGCDGKWEVARSLRDCMWNVKCQRVEKRTNVWRMCSSKMNSDPNSLYPSHCVINSNPIWSLALFFSALQVQDVNGTLSLVSCHFTARSNVCLFVVAWFENNGGCHQDVDAKNFKYKRFILLNVFSPVYSTHRH